MLHQPTKFALAVSFLTAILVANMSGPQYVYPAFGTSLTTKFNWSALENSLVSTASFVGVSFSGPLCAWMVEYLGIRGTLRVSGVLAFAGPFLLAQTYAGRLPSHFVLCAIYLACLGISGAAAYLCALDSQSHNFKAYRGMSMGLTSASLGLCGVVFSQVNDHFFSKDDGEGAYGLLLFMSIAMAGGMAIGAFILGPLAPPSDNDDDVPPNKNHHLKDDEEEQQPLLQDQQLAIGNNNHQHYVDDFLDDDTTLDQQSIAARSDISTESRELSSLEFFLHPAGFALFVALFVVLGLGYVYLASVGQILLSLPAAGSASPQHLRNVHVSVFSLANCSARAAFGTLSDLLKRHWGVHRLWMFVGATVGILFNMIYLITFVNTADDLLPVTVAMAVMYGTVFGVAPAATTEFGTQAFARNWGWLLYAPAFGSQIFNILFGALYDREAQRQGTHLCHGPSCFRQTYIVGIGCALSCIAVLTWAIIKLRLYQTSR
ncbi:major facilitator superfamily domain-containing protein [Phascolomyces articulosus]|uniref:Major facilitator superfamily domain-containing protein n=1 Tax=Phascolomyces articulosus TaxID=60185 RepID=A0AAD5K4I8_9FUNG|nr:major facilitator superfamily domain-containing protein [Phascolomyces articulosus]